MHVTERIDVYHQTHCRDHDEHHHRDRCQTEAQGKQQLHPVNRSEVEPREVERCDHRIHTCCRVTTSHEEILDGRIIAQHRHDSQRQGSDNTRRLMRHLHARQSQYDKRDQRQQKN